MESGIEAYISDLSMSMAQENLASAVQTKMLKNVMDTTEQSAAGLIEDMSEIPNAAYGSVGGLLDTSA